MRTGEGTRQTALDAVRLMPPLAAVALAHAVDYLKGFSSEVTLEALNISNRSPLEQRRPQHPHRHWTVF